MTPNEIIRIQAYLRKVFANNRIAVEQPAKRGGPIEVLIGEEFIGTLHRDEEEGEVSYALTITILQEDLPPASPLVGKSKA
jgi:hypothetical protein